MAIALTVPWDMSPEQEKELRAAEAFWAVLHGSVAKLALDGRAQIADPDVDECFLFDIGYSVMWRFRERGWVGGELDVRLSRLDGLLDRLSDDRGAWNDEAIVSMPLWEEVRVEARACLPLMADEPYFDFMGSGPEA
ncbi:hypothetical protein [Actinomadura hibisca]|uniref:hypothetical protein n=1 Tax=Actinomadura hibisca TaxID=68565 RepID=UPI00082EEEB4|nr:hypothetical protein [Actinomadura hibisca]